MGYVYLININGTDLYKIGITKNEVSKRVKSLQTGNPLSLVITDFFKSSYYQKIETLLHRMLKHKKYIPEDFENLKGEWFCFDFEDVKNFKKMCIKFENQILNSKFSGEIIL